MSNEVHKEYQERFKELECTPLDPADCFIGMSEGNLLWTLEELIRNAIDHSEPGQGITITSKRREGHCEIEVIDQGEGTTFTLLIPQAHLKPGTTSLETIQSQVAAAQWILEAPGRKPS